LLNEKVNFGTKRIISIINFRENLFTKPSETQANDQVRLQPTWEATCDMGIVQEQR